MSVRCLFLAIVAVFASSCEKVKNPHRAPSEPFQILDEYSRVSDLVVRASFHYDGDAVSLNGEVEIDRENEKIRISGSYLSSQELEPGVRFAMQSYDLNGELLVRNLPRMAFEELDSGEWRVEFDKTYAFQEMGIGYDEESILIQFNYVKEGEYWYDIRYPEIELPSIVLRDTVSHEHFRTLIGPVPLIVPIGFDCVYPTVVAASESNNGNFDYLASMEVISLPDGIRKEGPRQKVESARRLVGDLRLLAPKVRFEKIGRFQMRHGYVWDGVDWYGNNEDLGDYRTVFAVPSWLYFGLLILIFGLLLYAWKIAMRLESLLARRVMLFLVVLAGLYSTFVSMMCFGAWILIVSGIAYIVADLSISLRSRLYVITFLLFSLLEFYWGRMVAPWEVLWSGLLLSICIQAILLVAVLWIRNSVVLMSLIAFATLSAVSIYMLMNLYAKFFNDYPSLKVIGYADQVASISDSIWNVMEDSHFLSLAIVAWFWTCLLKAYRTDRRASRSNA